MTSSFRLRVGATTDLQSLRRVRVVVEGERAVVDAGVGTRRIQLQQVLRTTTQRQVGELVTQRFRQEVDGGREITAFGSFCGLSLGSLSSVHQLVGVLTIRNYNSCDFLGFRDLRIGLRIKLRERLLLFGFFLHF